MAHFVSGASGLVTHVELAPALPSIIFLELHSTTQMLTTCMHTYLYRYMYANPTPMSTFEGPSTNRSGDS
jgi:hypothetical protein